MKGRRAEAIDVLRKTYQEGANLEIVADEIIRHIEADLAAENGSSWKVRRAWRICIDIERWIDRHSSSFFITT